MNIYIPINVRCEFSYQWQGENISLFDFNTSLTPSKSVYARVIISILALKKRLFYGNYVLTNVLNIIILSKPLMNINKLQGFYLYTLVDYQAVTILEIYLYMDK